MEFNTPLRIVSERIKRKLALLTNQGINTETGRSYAEDRMIAKMEKYGGKAFRILRSAETTMKNYKRPVS